MNSEQKVLLGKIVGVLGVRGEMKIESFTDPRDALFRYQPWEIVHRGQSRELVGVRGESRGKNIIGRHESIDTREAAELLIGAEIWIQRSQLPEPKPGEYYWVDLEGLSVTNLEGVSLGKVSHMLATGANDVVVVRGEKLHYLPYIDGVVLDVDIAAGTMQVDWDPEF